MAKKPTFIALTPLEEQQLKNEIIKERILLKDDDLKQKQIENSDSEQKRTARESSHYNKIFHPILIALITIAPTLCLIWFTHSLTKEENTKQVEKTKTEMALLKLEAAKNDTLRASETLRIRTENFAAVKDLERTKDLNIIVARENAEILDDNKRLREIYSGNFIQNKNLRAESFDLKNKIEKNKIIQDSLQAINDFGVFSYNLWQVRTNNINTLLNAVHTLIDGIKYNDRFRNQIIDSLNIYTKLPVDKVFGTSNFILYFGTGDTKYKDNIMYEIRYNFKRSLKSMHYNNLFSTNRWSILEKKKIIKTIVSALDEKIEDETRALILETVAIIDNADENLKLYNADFNSFLSYIKYAKQISLKSDNYYRRVMTCLSVICPQIFLSKKFSSLIPLMKTYGPFFSNKKVYFNIDTVDLTNFYMLDNFYSDNKVSDFRKLLDNYTYGRKANRLTDYVNVTDELLGFWRYFFDGNPVDITRLKTKLENDTF
jgi:hypothetical protein